MNDTVIIIAHGHCEPAGSKKAFMRPGARFPVVVDANPKAKGWKERVGAACAEQYGGPFLEGALAMTVRFYAPRPAKHFGSGRNSGLLKDSAPSRPTVAPDVDKLSRAVLDGLQGQLYRNDSQVVEKHASKHYGEPARVEIEVAVLERQTVGEQVVAEQLALAS
jgi:Holliday junction resolvase RusA-like endonuclease